MKNQATFRKVVENFICQFCGRKVKGTGDTDHCPDCLVSVHVDNKIPGDRVSDCRGTMIPKATILKDNEWKILYQCQKCKVRKINRAAPTDNLQKLIELSNKPFVISKRK